MNPKVALFLNGEKPQKLPNIKHYDAIYCTDGAYTFLKSHAVMPDVISGDFDSLECIPNDLSDHVTIIHTPDQNHTDFEKALKIISSHGYNKVDVFSASGLEQDHFLGNLSTALKYKKTLNITFYDDRQHYYFLKKNTTISNVKNKTISLFPFPKATGVNSKGLKYPLDNLTLSIKKHQIGTRNHAIEDTIHLTFDKGQLLIFIAKKPEPNITTF